MGVRFVAQYDIGRFTIDFYLPEKKIAIEADGAYWHEKQQEQDARRDAVLLSQGITTIRITDRELKTGDATTIVFSKLLRGS